MDVARAGRQVREQEVQLAPACLVNHLPQGVDRHGAAPEQRVGRFDEEANRHQLDVLRPGGDYLVDAVLLHGVGQVALDAEHPGLRGSVDVGIEHADAVAHVAQRHGEVGRDGRLADAPLARGDGHHVADGPRRGAVLLLLGFARRTLAQHHRDGGGGEGFAQQRLGLRLELEGEGVARLGEVQRHGDVFVRGVDLLDEAALDQVLACLGVDERAEQLDDFLLCIHRLKRVFCVFPTRCSALPLMSVCGMRRSGRGVVFANIMLILKKSAFWSGIFIEKR